MPTKASVTFARKDYTPSGIGLKINPIDSKIWTIVLPKSWGDSSIDRYAQRQVQKLLKENFSSVSFFSPTSVYFYFTDEADEAFFITWANSEEISVDI